MRKRVVVGVQLAVGAAAAAAVVLARPVEGDPNVFLGIANRIAAGQVPYRDFPLEYPPLALVPVALPRMLADAAAYQTVFSLFSLAFTVATAAVLALLARAGWSASSPAATIATFTALVLAAAPSVIWRFDILPALLTTVALLAVARREPGWAGFALALGAATKLYPAFLVPVFVAYYVISRRWRAAGVLLLGFLLTIGATGAGLFALAGPGALSFLSYQGERGIEIESVVGGLALLAQVLGGEAVRISFGFGSWEVSSSVVSGLAVPALVVQAALGTALVVGAFVAFRWDVAHLTRIAPRTFVAYALATLLLVMLSNKVLSNQYICWLLPFGALLGWRQSALLVAICALTTFVYPLNFAELRAVDPLAVAALNARNVLLLVLFCWLLVPPRR